VAENIELPEAQILRLQPGDVIALTVEQSLSMEQIDQLKKQAEKAFGTSKVAVLSGGINVSIVRDETE
jgi:flagellar motor switch protein FliM